MAFKMKGFSPFTKTTYPIITYRGKWKEKLGVGKKKINTKEVGEHTYHFDKQGYVKKIVHDDGGVTRYKRKNRKYR